MYSLFVVIRGNSSALASFLPSVLQHWLVYVSLYSVMMHREMIINLFELYLLFFREEVHVTLQHRLLLVVVYFLHTRSS